MSVTIEKGGEPTTMNYILIHLCRVNTGIQVYVDVIRIAFITEAK